MTSIKTIAKVIILLVVVTLSTTLNIASAQAPAPLIPHTIQGQIIYYANIYGSNEQTLSEVAQCESSDRDDALGDHGLAYGVYQFHKDTFNLYARMYKSKFGGQMLDYYDSQDQIILAAWMFSQGKAVKDNWTCYQHLYGKSYG